ncbi:MAG: transcriptional regulator [Hyphomicrobium sp.]|nr:transcriptional regulator [Hyphomicrobium sp.]
MTKDQLITLLNDLRAAESEFEWLEFKQAKTSFDLETLGQYVSALSNEANLAGRPVAWLLFGVHDNKTEPGSDRRIIVGTTFKVGAAALNEVKRGVADHTTQRLSFRDIHEVKLDGKRVLMFEIPAAPPGVPTAWKGHFFGREGSSIAALSLAELDLIRRQSDDWSAEPCDGASIDDLDPAAIKEARQNFKIKNPKLAKEVDGWSTETFLAKAKVLRAKKITRAAILLLGKPESSHYLSPADPRITWVLKNADGTNRDYQHYGPPLLLATNEIASRVRNTNYQFMRDATLFPAQVLQFDPWVLRELLHNCIAHQDYRLNGRINLVEQEDALTFTNLGSFMPGSVETLIAANVPPDRYRNRCLAEAMVAFNMIDTLGSGIPKTFTIQRKRGFPMPDFDLSESQKVTVKLYGRVLDENYTRALFANSDLPLSDVIALDKVQKKHALTTQEVADLRRKKLIEGRKPNLYVAAAVAAAAGQEATYVLTAGFDDEYYKDLVVKMLRQFEQAPSKKIYELIRPKLPGALTDAQKDNKVRNLLQQLDRDGVIHNVGKHGPGAVWALKS